MTGRSRRFERARSIALDISPLRESIAYRALWSGQIVSLIGSQMRYVAISWQVFQITGSTVAVGLVALVEVVPLIVFSIVGGAVADRSDRRRLIVRSQLGLMATSAGLAGVALMDRPSLLLIYALTAVGSALNAIDRPARSAMVPGLVRPEQLSAAMALRQVVFQVTAILGPALGGLTIATLSVAAVYAIDAVTYVAAIVALRWVPAAVPAAPSEEVTALESIREGFRFARATPLILSIFLIDLIAMIFGMPRAVFPALAERTFGLGASGLGLLYAATSLGALVAALTTGWVPSVRRQGLAVLIAVGVWGAAITLSGLSLWSFPLTLFWLAVAGGADVVSAVFRGTMLLEATPDHLRGRITAVNIMVVTGGPRLGDVEAGLVAGLVGVPGSVILGGAACLVGTAAMATWAPSLRTYRSVAVLTPRT